tara:strand:- start:568 stop:1077 length:510 start_codon:yes stop_codon:yes gene_type:complete
MPQFSITSEIKVNTLRADSDNFYKLLTKPEDLLALAERFGWVSVDHLASELCIRKVAQDCWDVSGYITGQIIQSCIVTGAPVPENIDFHIEERYVHTSGHTVQVQVGLDGVEPIKNGAIDIGELAMQSLGLAATSWPRVDDAPGCYSVGEQVENHPFARLSELKHQDRE